MKSFLIAYLKTRFVFVFNQQVILIFLSLLLFAIHLPFLNADPLVLIPYGRDAFTDEGLYAAQIRNYIHNSNLTLQESDALIKTPLYGLLQFFWFSILGISYLKARLLTLLVVLIVLFVSAQIHEYYKTLVNIILAAILTMPPIFNYTHYSMAEMCSAIFILSGIIFLTEATLKRNIKYAIVSGILLSCSWLFKIQFIYILPAIGGALTIVYLFRMIKSKSYDAASGKVLFSFLITTGVFFGIFMLCWKMPNAELFDYVMKDQTNERWVPQSELYDYLDKMYEYYFKNELFKPSVQIFYASLLMGLALLFVNSNNRYLLLLFFASIWFISELHKLKMYYLPVRYLVSLFLSGGFIIAIVLKELFFNQIHHRFLKIFLRGAAFTGFVFLLYYNIFSYHTQYQKRTFSIKKINEYFSALNFDNRPVVGAWAASLTWESNALTLPVWNNYFDIDNILKKHNPKVIITEMDEADSGQAYSSKNINYEENADSVLFKKIDNWNIKIVWLK